MLVPVWGEPWQPIGGPPWALVNAAGLLALSLALDTAVGRALGRRLLQRPAGAPLPVPAGVGRGALLGAVVTGVNWELLYVVGHATDAIALSEPGGLAGLVLHVAAFAVVFGGGTGALVGGLAAWLHRRHATSAG